MGLFDQVPLPDLLSGQTPLLSPVSMLWAGNERDEKRGPQGFLPVDGSLTAGLRGAMFTLPAAPSAPVEEQRRPRQVSTGPTPQQVLTHGRRY